MATTTRPKVLALNQAPSPAAAATNNAKSFYIDIPASPMTNTTAQDIIQNCPAVSPINRSPPVSGNSKQPVSIEMHFSIDRITQVDDVDGFVAVSGQLYSKWHVITCYQGDSNGGGSGNVIGNERIFIGNIEELWHPHVALKNSIEDVSLKNSLFYNKLEVIPRNVDPPPKKEYDFYWKKRGIYKIACSIELSPFPFDETVCKFQFLLEEPDHLVQVADGAFFIQPSQKDSSQLWNIKHSDISIEKVPTGTSNETASHVTFSIVLQRHPDYYISNLLAPSILLTLISTSSFLIPARVSDRPLFNMYIFLAYVVIYSQVLGYVPRTASAVALKDFVMLLGVVCIYNTTFSAFILWCHVNFGTKNSAMESRISIIDIVGFFGALVFLGVVTIDACSKFGLI